MSRPVLQLVTDSTSKQGFTITAAKSIICKEAIPAEMKTQAIEKKWKSQKWLTFPIFLTETFKTFRRRLKRCYDGWAELSLADNG